jgi:hypothetical protein
MEPMANSPTAFPAAAVAVAAGAGLASAPRQHRSQPSPPSSTFGRLTYHQSLREAEYWCPHVCRLEDLHGLRQQHAHRGMGTTGRGDHEHVRDAKRSNRG